MLDLLWLYHRNEIILDKCYNLFFFLETTILLFNAIYSDFVIYSDAIYWKTGVSRKINSVLIKRIHSYKFLYFTKIVIYYSKINIVL